MYLEPLALCPMKLKERIVLYSKWAQCHLLLQQPLATISDAARALCVQNPPNCHAKSLWRRAQAHDMLGIAKERLSDSILFIDEHSECNDPDLSINHNKVPGYAERLVKKQMCNAWLFREAAMKHGGIDTECSDRDFYKQETDDSEWETVSESNADRREAVNDDDEEEN